MIGTEAAMVAVGFLSRIGLPYPITSRSGVTLSHALGRGWARHLIPRRAAQHESLSEATPNTSVPVRIAYRALGFLIVAAVALIVIEARYF
jgi:hypothetical protein